jgi:hypothetical protein
MWQRGAISLVPQLQPGDEGHPQYSANSFNGFRGVGIKKNRWKRFEE